MGNISISNNIGSSVMSVFNLVGSPEMSAIISSCLAALAFMYVILSGSTFLNKRLSMMLKVAILLMSIAFFVIVLFKVEEYVHAI